MTIIKKEPCKHINKLYKETEELKESAIGNYEYIETWCCDCGLRLKRVEKITTPPPSV